MSELQQETYQVMFKSSPQNLYQACRMLTMMRQFAMGRKQKKLANENLRNDLKKFIKLREELELPITEDIKEKFMKLTREQRLELIRDCEKKLMIKAGERDYEFLVSSNKMLAEPQVLDKEVNLDQLKNMLTEYGLQFHIKDLPDQTKELHFFSKDSNIAARAISRTLENIAADPECVTKPTLTALINRAKEQTKESLEKAKEKTLDSKTETKDMKETFDALSLFKDGDGGIEL